MIQTLLLFKCKLSVVSSQSSHGQPNAKIGFSNSVTFHKTIKWLKPRGFNIALKESFIQGDLTGKCAFLSCLDLDNNMIKLDH